MKQNGFCWTLFAPMIKSSIKARFGNEMAVKAIKNGKKQYRTLVEEAPDIGSGNPMASNAYFAYVFVGAWLGTDKKLTPDDLSHSCPMKRCSPPVAVFWHIQAYSH